MYLVVNMENKTPIEYIENNTELMQGEYYTIKVLDTRYINFTYDLLGNNNKPFLLDNNIRLNHLPNKEDIKTSNLQPVNVSPKYTEQENKELCIKGGKIARMNETRRKTFKESLELFLSLGVSQNQLKSINSSIIDKIPQDIRESLTQEDIINLKALELAQTGSINHQAFIRDTIGEKPTDKTQIEADIMTDGDRSLLDKVANRLKQDQE